MSVRRVLGTLGMLVCATACGCKSYTHGFPLPEGVKTVAVEIFKNKTLYKQIEFDFTSALQHEISAKSGLEIASRDKADAVVRGSIIDFRRITLRESREDEVEEYALVLVVSYEFVRLPTDGQPEQVLSASEHLSGSGDVLVLSAYHEPKVQQDVFRNLAGRVVSHMLEKW